MKTLLREKNEKCLRQNKKWTKTEKEWIEFKVDKEKELEKKEEEKKNIIDELKSRHKAEKEAIFKNENENCKKMKNEIEGLKEKYQNALNEIKKLAGFVNIFGKKNLNGLSLLHNLNYIRVISESQYVPTEISIDGRTKHWFAYTVQQPFFYLDGFDDEGYPIYVGNQKKMIKPGPRQKRKFVDETDEKNFKKIYLVHD